MSEWNWSVGDLLRWDRLPDGDVLHVTSVHDGVVMAQRGCAREFFRFTAETSPGPVRVEVSP